MTYEKAQRVLMIGTIAMVMLIVTILMWSYAIYG